MPAALSCDLRSRIVEARIREGLSYKEIAERFQVGEATVSRILRRFRESGSVEPRPHGGGTPRLVSDAKQGLLRRVAEQHPDATLHELSALFRKASRIKLSRATMCREMHRLGLTRKKSPSSPPNGAVQGSRSSARLSSVGCADASLAA